MNQSTQQFMKRKQSKLNQELIISPSDRQSYKPQEINEIKRATTRASILTNSFLQSQNIPNIPKTSKCPNNTNNTNFVNIVNNTNFINNANTVNKLTKSINTNKSNFNINNLNTLNKSINSKMSFSVKKDINGTCNVKLSTTSRRSTVRMLANSMKKSSVRMMKKSSVKKSVVQTCSDENRLMKRFYRIKELIETENTYVTNLQLLLERYYLPCKEKQMFDINQIEMIFQPILKIFPINKQFSYKLNELYENVKNYSQNDSVAEEVRFKKFIQIFDETIDKFDYSPYINPFDQLRQIVDSNLKSNPQFKELCITKTTKPLSPDGITSLMILPIQRIPRYVMMMKDIVDYTPQSKRTKELLEVRLKICKKANEIDQNKKEYGQQKDAEKENKNIIHYEEMVTKYNCINDKRRLIGKFEVNVFNGESIGKFVLILYNDIFILTHPKDDKYKVHTIKHLKYCTPISSLKTNGNENVGETVSPAIELKKKLLRRLGKKSGDKITMVSQMGFCLKIVNHDTKIPKHYYYWPSDKNQSSLKIRLIEFITQAKK